MGEARRLYRVTVLGESEPREKRDVVTPLCPVCAPPVHLGGREPVPSGNCLPCMDHLLQEALSDPALPTLT